MESRITKGASRQFFTTDDAADFDSHASVFYGEAVQSKQVHLT
jgi:glutamate racemase